MFPLSTSKSYHHGDLRTALLDSTLGLVTEVGIEGLSLREVSRRAGVSHAAAYNHFPNKAALVRAFVEDGFTEFRAALEAGREAGVGPVDALREIGVAYVRFACEHPAQFRVMFRPELSGIKTHEDLPAADSSYSVLVGAIETALAAGAIRGNVDALVRVSWALVHGLSLLILDGPGESVASPVDDVDAMTSEALAILLFGMMKPPA